VCPQYEGAGERTLNSRLDHILFPSWPKISSGKAVPLVKIETFLEDSEVEAIYLEVDNGRTFPYRNFKQSKLKFFRH
jgi:hypothetical protein